jgi:hypothetical protein
MQPSFKILIRTFKLLRKNCKFWFRIIIHIDEVKVKNWSDELIYILSIVKPYKSHFGFVFFLLCFLSTSLLLINDILLMILFIFKIVLLNSIQTYFNSFVIIIIRLFSKCVKTITSDLIVIT